MHIKPWVGISIIFIISAIVSSLFLLIANISQPQIATIPLVKDEKILPKNSNEEIQKQTKNTVTIGSPCSQDDVIAHQQKLQCYFFGEVPQEGESRLGIWIVPNIARRDPGSYKDFVSNWKKYESPDKKITFEYPQTWSIIEQKVDGSLTIVMGNPSDTPPFINIHLSMERPITSPEDYKSSLNGNIFSETKSILNGSDSTRFDVAPTTNILNETINLFIHKKNYHIAVSAEKFNDPILDFPTEYLLSTITLH